MKNVMFKRIISMVLCLCMVLSYAPATVFAAEKQVTDLEISGVTVVEDGVVKTSSGTGWTYSSDGVLNLNYASIFEVSVKGGSLTVNVLGNSNIVASSGYDPFYADNCDVTFNVSEGKSLTITCTKGQSAVYLYNSDVYFTGKGTVNLKGSGATGAIDGIGDIYIDGVTMTMKNSSSTAGNRYVIGHGKNVYIGETTAANVTVTSHSDDTGAFGESTVSVKNGSVLTVNAPSGYGFGGTGGAALKVSGSTVNVTADNGVFGSGTLTLVENSLVAKGSTSADGSNAAFYNQSSHWDYKYLNVHPGYAITIDGNIQGATVAANTTAADAGDSVMLTVTPKTARTLTSLTVGGSDVTASVQENQNGTYTYTFTMPSRDVAVSAALKVDPEKCPHEMYVDGACADCGTACGHNYVDGICQSCASLAAVKVTAGGTATWYEDMDAANAYIAKQTGGAQVMLISDAAIKGDSSKEFSFAPNTVTLDLNGKTLTAAGNVYYPEGSNVTVTDTNPDGGGAFIIRGYTHKIKAGGKVTVEGGKISSGDYGIENDSGTLNISGGEIIGNDCGVSNNGTLNISGGSVAGTTSHGIYNTGGIEMTGGSVTGGSGSDGIYIESTNGKTVEISGGTVSGGRNGLNNAGGSNLIFLSGGTFLRGYSTPTTGQSPQWWLRTGCNFVYLESGAPYTYYAKLVTDNLKVVCSHKTWTEGVCNACGTVCPHETYSGGACTLCKEICSHEEFGADNKCKECGIAAAATVTVGSTTTYHLTVEKAMEKIPTDGTESTLTLLRNYTGGIRIAEGMNVVLSGGDYGIKPSSGDAITVSGGTLKVVSGTVKGNNAIYITSGRVTVSGGTVTGDKSGIYNNYGGSVTVTGGSITAANTWGIGIYNGTAGTAEISGGTVSARGTSSHGVENSGTLTVSGGTVEGYWRGIYNSGNAVLSAGTVTGTGTSGCGICHNGAATVTVSGTARVSGANSGINNLSSGKVSVTGGSVVGGLNGITNQSSGTILVSGGKVEAADTAGEGIYNDDEYGSVIVSGGTVSGTAYALYNRFGSTKVKLSGGIFLGGIYASSGSTVYMPKVSDLLAESYQYAKYDLSTGVGEEIVLSSKVQTTEDLAVVCSHNNSHPDSIAPSCQGAGYCGVCKEAYGDKVPHSIDRETGCCTAGCGEFLAKVVVWDQMINDKLYYYEGIDAANQFEPSAYSTLCMKLLEDVTAQGSSGIFFFGKAVQLDLNGHTLTLPALQYRDNAVVKVMDTSEGGEGKISTTSHFIKSGAKLTLESGTLDHAVRVEGTFLVDGGTVADTVTVQGEGSLTVNDGVISSVGYGIIADTNTARITVTGGTVSGGKDANALYNQGNSGNIALSGGVFMGGIWACDNTLADTDTPEYLLKDLLADGYGYAAYDTTNGVGEVFAGTDFRSVNNLTVVCAHKNIGYAGEGDLATAYCRNGNCHLPANTVLGTLQVVAKDAVYDGNPHGASVKTTGILQNIATRLEYQDLSSEKYLNGPPSKVGTYRVICFSDAWISPSAEYRITEATPVYEWQEDAQEYPYTGKTVEIIPPVPTHLEGSDAFDGEFAYAYTGTTAGGETVSGQGLPTDAGEYAVTASATAWGSYTAAEVPGSMSLTIEKASLTVTAEDKGYIFYGDAAPKFTAKYSGFVNGEDEGVLEGSLTFFSGYDTADPEKRNAGTYDIIPSGLTADNYTITFRKGTLEVKAKTVTVKIDDKTLEYGEAGILPHQYSFTPQQTLPYGETMEDVKANITVSSDYTQGADANQTFELRQNGYSDESDNYHLANVIAGELTVLPRTIIPSLSGSVTKTYDGNKTVPAGNSLTILLANVVAGDDVSVSAAFAYGQSGVGENITVTAGSLKITGADAENYTLAKTSLSAKVGRITKASVTGLTFPKASAITYGQKLEKSALAGGKGDGTFAWADKTSVPTVGNGGCTAVFTPRDTANYDYSGIAGWDPATGTVRRTLQVTVNKAEPVLGKVTANDLVDTTDLSKVVITAQGGIPGTFSVNPGQTIKEGENTLSYTFTPDDTVNYNKVTGTVTVTVKKTVCDGGKNCPLQKFTDVTSSHWAHHGMDFAINTGLMKGTGTGKTFEPNTNMSRAMLVTVLWRYSGSPDAPDCSFTDVETDDWFYEAVAWAASEGVVKGMGDGSWFDPNGDVTREMLATILCRYADMIGVDTSARASIASFPDEEKVSGWSYNYMKWAVAEGIISGAVKDGKTVLAPQDSANRAVVATIMMRLIQSFEN